MCVLYIIVTYSICYSAWYHWYHNIMPWILFLSCGNILLSFPWFFISYIFCFLLINSIKIPLWWIDFDVCHCWRVKKYFELLFCNSSVFSCLHGYLTWLLRGFFQKFCNLLAAALRAEQKDKHLIQPELDSTSLSSFFVILPNLLVWFKLHNRSTKIHYRGK